MVKLRSKACIFASISLWILLSCVVLVITCFLHLRVYLQALRFTDAGCRVRNTFYREQFVCSCGDRCYSIYPCFMVQVSLESDDDLILPLYLDVDQLMSVTMASSLEREMVS